MEHSAPVETWEHGAMHQSPTAICPLVSALSDRPGNRWCCVGSRIWEVSVMVGSLWALEGGCRQEGTVKTESSTQGSYKGDTDLLLLYPASSGPIEPQRQLWS